MSTHAMPAPPRPSPARPRDYAFPRFERRTLANGMRLVVAPVHKLPLVTALAVVEAGAVSDGAGSEGLALLTARALVEGTASADGAVLTDRLERLGTALDSGADWDSAVARLTVHASRLPEALSLLGEVLTTPAFAERDVERLKAERQAEILQLRAEPRGLADETFDRVLYAEGSRYAAPDGGTAESVGRLTSAELRRFHEARYRPGATTLVIVGDVTASAAERLTERVFGGWLGSSAPAISPADRPARFARAVHLVGKPDAPQSELRIGHVGLPRNHPDYFPATVMNAVLGGLFSSRINLNLRERNAYTYGAFSGFEWRRGAGPWSVSTAVQSDRTAAAASETLLEIDRTRAEEIDQDELTLATSYLDGVFPIRFETTAAIAVALANMEVFGLPADYYDTYRANVRGVTTADVLAAARRHLHPERLQLLVVGDPSAVRIPLEQLGFGPMIEYDAEGKVVG